jgi:hypothetical protein
MGSGELSEEFESP